MRIGIDASRANVRERTGTEWYSYHIIAGIVARDRSIDFTLYVDDEPLPELATLGPNVTIRRLRWPFRLLWSQLRLSWEMLVRPPDVLFVPAHTIPIIHPRRTVTTIHDLGFEHDPALYDQRPIGGPGALGDFFNSAVRTVTLGKYGNSELDYHRWSTRFAVRHAYRIITVSQFTRDDIIASYGARPDRIEVVYHGFDKHLFTRPPETAIRSALDLHNLRQPYAVFVGRLERKKNILRIVQSFDLARQQHPELTLVLIGREGFGWNDARAYIAAHHLDPYIRTLGWQPNDVTVPIVAGASALMLLSEFEGFGMTLLEAFSLGTPVIAARKAALPEIAGDAARLVDPHDLHAVSRELLALVTDPAFRTACVARGTRRLEHFAWERAAAQTLSLLAGNRTS